MSDTPDGDGPLAYARSLHAEAASINRDLNSRAQAVLTLDGLVIGVFSAVVSAKPDDVAKTVSRTTTPTAALAAIAVGALALSVVSAFLALYSRHLSGPGPAKESTSHLWFYARIAEVDPQSFVAKAREVGPADELTIRLNQVAIMAPIMRTRAGFVNGAYAFAAVAFIFQLFTGVSYLVSF